MLRSNGIDIYADIVDNHRDGDDGNYNFVYADAYGNASGGRFGKSKYDFHPNVAQDSNVWDGNNEVSFGRDLAPINGPGGWIYNGLISAAGWETNALDLQGYRMDYVKGISADWLKAFLSSSPMSGKFSVGEFFDSNLANVQAWLFNSNYMNGTTHAFDFPLRDQLKSMCNNPSGFNMANLDHAGLAGSNPMNAVTFVENHDTDGSDPITQNKLLAYAYILTSEGYPCVFYKDWSKDTGCYGSGLQAGINNLIWCHENLASGTTTQRWKNNLVFIYERQGGQHLLVGLNNNTGYDYYVSGVQTGFGANVHLHDYTGHLADIYTDGTGKVSFDLPVATNGNGYCCFAPAGINGSFTAPNNTTTQEYDGATDLDIQPADNTQLVQVAQLYAQSGKQISGNLSWSNTGFTSSTQIYLEYDNPSGTAVASQTWTGSSVSSGTLNYTPTTTGYYTVKIRSYNTPSSNQKPSYQYKATYTAPLTGSF